MKMTLTQGLETMVGLLGRVTRLGDFLTVWLLL
jgi:hypothetical protein